jgi:hypothetical protein
MHISASIVASYASVDGNGSTAVLLLSLYRADNLYLPTNSSELGQEMTRNEEYEQAYREAVDALHRRGKRLGKPWHGREGQRHCPVDGVLLTDRDLLKEAWGVALADEILRSWVDTDPRPLFCRTCDQLWEEYAEATARHLKALIEWNTTERRESADIAVLDVGVQQTARIRRTTRLAIRDHVISHPAFPL